MIGSILDGIRRDMYGYVDTWIEIEQDSDMGWGEGGEEREGGQKGRILGTVHASARHHSLYSNRLLSDTCLLFISYYVYLSFRLFQHSNPLLCFKEKRSSLNFK